MALVKKELFMVTVPIASAMTVTMVTIVNPILVHPFVSLGVARDQTRAIALQVRWVNQKDCPVLLGLDALQRSVLVGVFTVIAPQAEFAIVVIADGL